jgi:hypothetical protein
MHKQRIYVNVVGFSDVERHALNTVFRLSAERDVQYEPWIPSEGQGDVSRMMNAEVVLVDGDSAEAVLSQARAMPAGQRLIWVGANPPRHAWRVWRRPIRWADVVNDLDAVFAAKQADSGFLDLDISSPQPLSLSSGEAGPEVRRALLVGVEGGDLSEVRSQLAAVGVEETDETDLTDSAADLIARNKYCCGVFNLDGAQLDAWALARLFASQQSQAMALGMSKHAGSQSTWWNRRLVRKESQKIGVNALLGLPLQAPELAACMARLR